MVLKVYPVLPVLLKSITVLSCRLCLMIFFLFVQAFDLFGQQLLQADHFASGEVEERLESMAAAREDLEKAWIARRMQLDQCLELQLFYRY
jgi:hypothetical protein